MTDVSSMVALECALPPQRVRPILVFGPFEADEDSFELRRDGQPLVLPRQVLEVIFFMLKTHGKLVTLKDLMRGPWRGTVVSHAAISRAVMLARRALSGESRDATKSIVTVHGKGYRFVGSVSTAASASTSPPSSRQLGGAGTDQPIPILHNERVCSMGEHPFALGVGCRALSCWRPASSLAPSEGY